MVGKAELVKKLRDMRPVDSLILLPDNPRHGDIGAISQSLERFGQQKPIVINRDGVILAGNHTFQAAKALGWDEIWVAESELEGADQPGFALADNRLSDLATYDHDALLRYLEEQPDLTGTGYSLEDMEEVREQIAFEQTEADFAGDERFTPAWLFEAMGVRFDVDVAAPFGGVPYIPVDRMFTKTEDGLAQDWAGLSVWCNPPYSDATAWARKFLAEVSEGCLLVTFSNGSGWQTQLMAKAQRIWVPDPGSIEFGLPSGMVEGIRWPVWLFGVGDLGLEALTNLGVAFPDRGVVLRAV